MTVSQWYQYLLEEGVTMVEDQEGGQGLQGGGAPT